MGLLDKVVDVISDPVKTVSGGLFDLDSAQGMWDSFTGKRQQRDANQVNLQSAREQMMFQERMSNTSHQRQVRDLKAAGLNPVLSSNSGASVPSGAMATISPEPSNSRVAFSSALDLRSAIQEQRVADQGIRTSQSAADLNTAQALNTMAEVDLKTRGAPGRLIGSDLHKAMKKLIERTSSSAKESFTRTNFKNILNMRKNLKRYDAGKRAREKDFEDAIIRSSMGGR